MSNYALERDRAKAEVDWMVDEAALDAEVAIMSALAEYDEVVSLDAEAHRAIKAIIASALINREVQS